MPQRLPIRCVVGAPLLFGRSPFTLVRLVVPTPELLATQAEVHRLSLPHLIPGPADNTLPGRWTPHVTLARRVDATQLARVLTNRGADPRVDGQRHRGASLGRRNRRVIAEHRHSS